MTDSRGASVRTLKGGARRGFNRVVWDLRMDPAALDGREAQTAIGFNAPQAPLVLPGVYTVTVQSASAALKDELRVEGDPRVTFTDADRRARQAALLALFELQKALLSARAAAIAGVTHFEAL